MGQTAGAPHPRLPAPAAWRRSAGATVERCRARKGGGPAASGIRHVVAARARSGGGGGKRGGIAGALTRQAGGEVGLGVAQARFFDAWAHTPRPAASTPPPHPSSSQSKCHFTVSKDLCFPTPRPIIGRAPRPSILKPIWPRAFNPQAHKSSGHLAPSRKLGRSPGPQQLYRDRRQAPPAAPPPPSNCRQGAHAPAWHLPRPGRLPRRVRTQQMLPHKPL